MADGRGDLKEGVVDDDEAPVVVPGPSDSTEFDWQSEFLGQPVTPAAPARRPAADAAAVAAPAVDAPVVGDADADGGATDVAAQSAPAATPVEEASTDEEEVSTDEAVGPHETPARPRGGRLGRRIIAAGTAIVVVVLAVLLAVTASSLHAKDAAASARTAALSAARTYAVDLTSYDYRHLDQVSAVVVSHSTPAFVKSYRQSFGTIQGLLVKYHATATGTVVAAGVESSTTSHAVVLLYVDQSVVNTTHKGTTNEPSRLVIDLVHSGGHWEINQVSLP